MLLIVILMGAGCAASPPDELSQVREKITAQAQQILAKDVCETTFNEIQQALTLAGEAQKIGEDALADRLISWVKAAFEANAAKKSCQATAKERYEMAAEAQKLGLDKLADDLMAGKTITSQCGENWRGVLDMKTLVTTSERPIHVDFAFSVKKNQIAGSGSGTHKDRFAGTQGCKSPLNVCCIQFVDNPTEAKISGQKNGDVFQLKFNLEYLFTQSACGVSLPKNASAYLPVSIPIQDGAVADCSTSLSSCQVKISKCETR